MLSPAFVSKSSFLSGLLDLVYQETHFSRPKYLLFPFTSVVFGAFAWPLEMWARCVIQLPHEQAGESTAGAAYGNQIFRFLG